MLSKLLPYVPGGNELSVYVLCRGAPTLDPDLAATRVQKVWKGFAQRRRTRKEREDEMMFIGMVSFIASFCHCHQHSSVISSHICVTSW